MAGFYEVFSKLVDSTKKLLIAEPFLCHIKFTVGLVLVAGEVQARSTSHSTNTMNPSGSGAPCRMGT